jgi:glucose uptake protein GlcU
MTQKRNVVLYLARAGVAFFLILKGIVEVLKEKREQRRKKLLNRENIRKAMVYILAFGVGYAVVLFLPFLLVVSFFIMILIPHGFIIGGILFLIFAIYYDWSKRKEKMMRKKLELMICS